MKRYAFTMLELVFVIIVIGILAVLAMPNFGANQLQRAAEQVAAHIRYTQHLAMTDDKYNPTDVDWYKLRWQIRFREAAGEIQYAVFSNKNKDLNINCNAAACVEPAIDPLTGMPMFFAASRPNTSMILSNYGITDLVVSCNTDDNFAYATRLGVIAFDHIGRPYRGVYDANSESQYILAQECNITMEHPDGNATISIQPETGFVSVNY